VDIVDVEVVRCPSYWKVSAPAGVVVKTAMTDEPDNTRTIRVAVRSG
jgi:hypothetical protein